jgi:hypothetical protein
MRGTTRGCGYSVLKTFSDNEVSRGRRDGAAIKRENESNENNGARGGGLILNIVEW